MINNQQLFDGSKPAGFDGLFEWDWLKGAFGPSIMPMDFDAVVERHGQFLLYETKHIGVPVPKGQLITLESLVKNKVWTVFILHGKRQPKELIIWTADEDGSVCERIVNPVSRRIVWDESYKWFQKANAGGNQS